MTIGVLDWGIGGIATLQRLREARADLDLVYRSDAGSAPYGTLSEDALAARVQAVAEDLDRRFGLTGLVLACNAASTIAGRLRLGFPVFDVITPGVVMARAAALKGARVGIIGGRRTIESRAHAAALPEVDLVAVVAQPLSAHVEAGRLDGPELLADLMPVVEALGAIDALLLACTHYPALEPVLRRLRPEWQLIDPVDALITSVCTQVAERGSGAPSASVIAETSGDPSAAATAAAAAFNVAIHFETAASPHTKSV